MRKLMYFIVAAVALLLTAVPATANGTGATICETFEAPFTGEADDLVVPEGGFCVLEGAKIHGNVLAQPGSELQMGPETTIEGNVDVLSGAFTGAFAANILGSYRCHDCVFQDVVFTNVAKNVEIRGADDGDFIISSTIGGNLEITDSAVGVFAFAILGNVIDGNLTLIGNAGAMGVEDNFIGGHLTIVDNKILESLCAPDACPPFGNGNVEQNHVERSADVSGNSGEPMTISENSITGDLHCSSNDPAPSGAVVNSAKRKRGQCRDL